MNKRVNRNYDKEFKINTVKLYLESGRSVREFSKEMGIPSTTLLGWCKDYEEKGVGSFPGKGNTHADNKELLDLRKELAIIKEERDILKKALGIFSSPRK